MVASGTISVGITNYSPQSAQVTVNARPGWATSPASAVQVPNGTFLMLPVPPQPQGNDAGVGEYYANITFPGLPAVSPVTSGPNAGFGYYDENAAFSTAYQYEINPDLENTSSIFYTSQWGNYPTPNPGGCISGANLRLQTHRHEHGSAQSHYANYTAAMAGPNNPGKYFESRIAAPGYNPSVFDTETGQGLIIGDAIQCISGVICSILASTKIEPPGVNEDAFGNFLGDINYAPYTSPSEPCRRQ